MAWKIRGSPRQALWAAHALLGESAREEDLLNGSAIRSRLIVVSARVGAKRRVAILTNAITVGTLVDALGVRGRWSSKPSAESRLRPHAMIRVTLVRQVRRTVTEGLPFQTLIQYSRDLAPGQSTVLRAGHPGLARRTYVITFRNGVRTSARVVAETILARPVDQIESRGAPGAAPSGVQYGQATWYDCDGMHAAHRTLPFGTAVTVTNLDTGQAVTVTINDRGPYADGRIIDLCDGAFAQIAPLGQGVADVKITY
jgi:Lytic transglycolase/G5 domain